LTTACQDFERIGQLAAELMIERSNKASFAYRHMFLDAPQLICGSTDRPRSSTRLECIRNAE